MDGRASDAWNAARTSLVSTVDGRTLGVCEWGDPDSRPIIFLHGTPGSRLLRDAGDAYLRYRLRVYTYDRPGYGLSTPHPGRRVADVAADVGVIADHFGLENFGVAGVSGGGPAALAAAALLPGRVSRCATIVGNAPYGAEGLEFYADMEEETRQNYEHAVQGEDALQADWQAILEWANVGLTGVDMPDDVIAMLSEAVQESIRQGPAGYFDDCLSSVRDWGFSLDDVRVPTRIMVARDDTSSPPAHGQWVAAHLPEAELIWVDGGHLGPRGEAEFQLLSWVGGNESSSTARSTGPAA